jgi:hypothetical protein
MLVLAENKLVMKLENNKSEMIIKKYVLHCSYQNKSNVLLLVVGINNFILINGLGFDLACGVLLYGAKGKKEN